MDEIIKQIKSQVEINFLNIKDQIEVAELEAVFDGVNGAVHGVAKSWTRLSKFTFTFHFPLSCIGNGNGNSLQCSCLENPRDGGACWVPSMGSHRVGHD